MVDAYSKWLEVYTMPATTYKRVIDVLRSFFPTFALPKILFSDNATNLASNEINKFLRKKKKNQKSPVSGITLVHHTILQLTGKQNKWCAKRKKALLKLTEEAVQ